MKFLLRKSRAHRKRGNSTDKFLFNEIYTTVEWVYQFNGAELKTHTDGKKNFNYFIIFS